MSRYTNWRQRQAINSLDPIALPRSLSLASPKRALLVAPHSDDEVLGCGGTLALLVRNNCEVQVIIVTDSSGAGALAPGAAQTRRLESIAALGMLGIENIKFWDEPDGSFRGTSAFEQKMLNAINEFQPDWLLVPAVLDYHRDHVAISHSVYTAWLKLKRQTRLLQYEIWCPIPATWVVDITSVQRLKEAAIKCYAIPLASKNYLHANIGLAAYRSLYLDDTQGTAFAEAFVEIEAHTSTQRLLRQMLELRLCLERQIKK